MRDWLVLMAHLIVTTIRTVTPGGARAVIAESLLLKHQLLILNRSRKKAPKLRAWDRILLGLGTMLVSPQRILKLAVAIRPSTLLRLHRALVRRKYQWLFSGKPRRRPGPKGPSQELIPQSPRSSASTRALAVPASPSRFRTPAEIAIVPIGFCYPGAGATAGDDPPRPERPALWHARLLRHLPDLKFTLLVGQYAQRHYP